MKTQLWELIHFAREHSAYYRALYREVPEGSRTLSDYPVIDQESFWKANAESTQGVLTASHTDGIALKSGGTTGNPKYSYFTAQEWKQFIEISGKGFVKNGVKPGDRIANLFYAGELYASFLYVNDLIESAETGVVYPVGGQIPLPLMMELLCKLKINVIAGLTTTLMALVEYCRDHPEKKPPLELILFGGESFYEDQEEAVRECFGDGIKVHSILYASVDGGELGYFDAKTCKNGEHRCFDESTVMEIVDEDTLEPVTETGKVGKLLVTNLSRHLMPLIRYPTGDRAQWVEPEGTPDRKFRLAGRSEEGARIGPITLYVQDVLDVLKSFHSEVHMLNFQIVLTHDEKRDRATIRVAPQTMPEQPEVLAKRIIEAIHRQRKLIPEMVSEGKIHPLSLEWCAATELEHNPRSGKTKHIVDKRLK